MNKNIILLGDKTSHGGIVITATSDLIINGKKVAKVGDKVNCPKKGHGINSIIEGSSDFTCQGTALATEGCHTECGCYLISSITNFSLD
ncbi:PAAR domain-containing protein [Proteus vulgaris]|uniref:PAAR domain-containing protein n=1 Tax=Proteus cibi TaxID=2050966 RepID=A0ABU6EHN2_9GAMM|nr:MULTISPECIES: PAAR domain-containing protein [Proteus]MCT8248194.1 PAAR domain-containing protein [Proteus faecis]MEB6858586.1 PAAR domain-containing protein [Proteus cibi]MEB7089991.1 PAAR domain-containing protein [Proteus cibi]QNH66743.1 PAAR domain-containing protein [Proteus vulgaris]